MNIVALLVATMANFWFWQILKINILLCALLLTIEVILIKNKRGLPLLFLLTFISIYILKTNLYKNIWQSTPTEIEQQNKRHAYLSDGLGKLFTNKFVLQYYKKYNTPVGKYLTNVSYSIDPNLYFFKSHPRERSGFNESNRLSPILLLFFLFGLYLFIANYQKYTISLVYLLIAIIISGFIDPYFTLGPIFMFPFINFIIYLGLEKTILWLQKRK